MSKRPYSTSLMLLTSAKIIINIEYTMSNNLVKTDKFKNAKRSLANLKKGAPSVIYLPQFPTSGEIFRFTKHNVTGDEANENLVKPLQTTIITLNSHISNLLGFIDEIYGLIDWLDNEYTKGIETAIDAAKESSSQALTASNQALKASKKAQKASEDASKAQEDIKRTIAALQLTVGKLKEFKEITTNRIGELSNDFTKDLARLHQQLDGITKEIGESAKLFKSDIAVIQDYKSQLEAHEHLDDVDAIWANVEQHKKNLTEFHQQLDGIAKEISESAKLFKSDIAVLQDYKSQLEAYEHLRDVDAIWANVEQHKKNLTELHQQLDGIAKEICESAKLFKGEIAVLQDYKSQLEAYEHLGDVDAIWGEVEQHKKNLMEFYQQLEYFATEYQSDKKDIQSSIKTIIEENVQSNNAINKKIKMAYIVAGFSVAITIVQFVLNLLHVI